MEWGLVGGEEEKEGRRRGREEKRKEERLEGRRRGREGRRNERSREGEERKRKGRREGGEGEKDACLYFSDY